MEFLKNVLKGLFIGIGAVAPGVSGGTFAVILGIYDKLTDAIANFYKNFKKKMIFLIPLSIGVGLGILGFSKIMKYLFEFHEAPVKFLFIGLMVGTLPSVFREANKKGFKPIYILPCVVTFSITVLAMMIESNAVIINILFNKIYGLTYYSILGFVMGSILTILPPVSAGQELMVGITLCLIGFLLSFKLNKLML